MTPKRIAPGRHLEELARLERELGGRLDDLLDSVLAADAAQARSELWAWCAFAFVITSGLTVIAALVSTMR
jgi:hypothetical protein